MARASAHRTGGPGDDIPQARRSQPLPRSTARRGAPLGWLLAGGLLLAMGAVLLRLAALRPAPAPVPGLQARLSADGRLLNHLSYPEAAVSQLVPVAPGLQLQPDAAAALARLQTAAAADGVSLTVLSAFRSQALQRQLFFDVKADRNQSSRQRARVSAPPGFSEHSTGFAVDLGDATRPDTNLSTSFDTTPAYRWLAANAARYHFELSFPRGNRQGVSYEPWHWRFEGSTAALRLFERSQRFLR